MAGVVPTGWAVNATAGSAAMLLRRSARLSPSHPARSSLNMPERHLASSRPANTKPYGASRPSPGDMVERSSPTSTPWRWRRHLSLPQVRRPCRRPATRTGAGRLSFLYPHVARTGARGRDRSLSPLADSTSRELRCAGCPAAIPSFMPAARRRCWFPGRHEAFQLHGRCMVRWFHGSRRGAGGCLGRTPQDARARLVTRPASAKRKMNLGYRARLGRLPAAPPGCVDPRP